MTLPADAADPRPPLVLVPGLGADADIYTPQRAFFGRRLVVPPWVDPLPHDTLATYAQRLARAIDVPGPFWVGGISFGGMIAAEVAALRPDVRGLFLLSSCTHRRQITPIFRAAARVGPYIPNGLAKGLLNRVAPTLFAAAEGLEPDGDCADLLARVAYRTDTRLLKWGAGAVAAWRGNPRVRCPVYLAHGGLDRVIPCDVVGLRDGVDLFLPTGRHLVNLTHADVLNRWMASKMATPALPAA